MSGSVLCGCGEPMPTAPGRVTIAVCGQCMLAAVLSGGERRATPTPEACVSVERLRAKADEWDADAEAYESVHLARCADDLRGLISEAEGAET